MFGQMVPGKRSWSGVKFVTLQLLLPAGQSPIIPDSFDQDVCKKTTGAPTTFFGRLSTVLRLRVGGLMCRLLRACRLYYVLQRLGVPPVRRPPQRNASISFCMRFISRGLGRKTCAPAFLIFRISASVASSAVATMNVLFPSR